MNDTTVLEQKLQQAHELYFSLYKKLKKWALAVWDENKVVYEQIKHGASHSQKIAAYAGTLLRHKLQANGLNAEELFLINAAIYLHDIGMQTGWKEFLEIDGSLGELTRQERLRIRQKHAETTAFVIRSWQTRLPGSLDRKLAPAEKDILCQVLNEPLAFTCQCHNQKDIAAFLDLELNREQRFRDRKFNIALAAALLQLCDALDMDKYRLNEERFKDFLREWLEDRSLEVSYEDNDWKRFFQCHFVEQVRLEPVFETKAVFKICINVRFHPDEDREIRDRFLDIYNNRLQKTSHDCVTVLNREADIHFLNDNPFNIQESNTEKVKIPEKLLHLLRPVEKQTTAVPPGAHPPREHQEINKSFCGGVEGGQFLQKAPPPSGLLGRDRDIKTLTELIMNMREPGVKKLITLKGAPGIGKTVLARALLRQDLLLPHFTHGCCFIPLEGVDSKENLVLQINTRLEIAQTAEEAPLLEYLAQKNILMVLDNFEDPLRDRGETTGLLRRLLGVCRSAVLVCTSREALRDAALEVIHPVEKLDRQSAKELLISLARAQGCDLELSAPDLDALLEELEDVPLAISLAAPYLVYGVKELLVEIKTRGVAPLEIINVKKEHRDKYSSLDRCFWLSYRTIEGTGAEALFQAAALFPAGFTREDTEQLLPGLAFHQFMELETKSLLEQRRTGEFSMLAPLRHYAFQIFLARTRPNVLEEQWLKLVMEKSREYENTTCGKGSKELNRLIRELPDIYMALDYLLQEVSQRNERKEIKETIFALLGNMVDFFRFQGIYQQAGVYLERALRLAKESADTANEAYCIYKLGKIFFYGSRNPEAMAAFQQALPLYKKIGDLLGEANCIRSMGDIHFLESRNPEAMAAFQQALPLYKKMGDLLGEANCIKSIGDIHFLESRNPEAMAAFQQALPLYKKIGHLLGEANCIKDFGRIHLKDGNLKKGKNHLEQALDRYNTINDSYSTANACYEYALLLKEIPNQKKQASQLFQQAADIFAAINLPKDLERCKKYLSTG